MAVMRLGWLCVALVLVSSGQTLPREYIHHGQAFQAGREGDSSVLTLLIMNVPLCFSFFNA